jgi:hypothetical protein
VTRFWPTPSVIDGHRSLPGLLTALIRNIPKLEAFWVISETFRKPGGHAAARKRGESEAISQR